MKENTQTLLIIAGGTGGHVFPGLAIAEAFQAKGYTIAWLGTPQGLEAQLIPEAGIPFYTIPIQGLRGKKISTWIKAPFLLIRALMTALKQIKRINPQLVIGMGGFVSGPGGLAAWLLRIPLIIHEQNAVAGLTNRLLAKIATKVLEGFPQTFPHQYRAIYTGNPIRQSIAAIPNPSIRYHYQERPLRLLVMGGSLGAATFNTIIPQMVAQLKFKSVLDVMHQTGKTHFESVQAKYAELKISGNIAPFIRDMAAAYAWADIVLCRAGALTITELTAGGIPAILVPYPYAVDDHQTKNGQFLVNSGAALMIQQTQLTSESLWQVLEPFVTDRLRLQKMAQAAKVLFNETAIDKIMTICVK
ncbi:MAG: UDP-N-acetylglucosamine--N-acetylmuramyl-(pentapeptide) pyrophosphoryl-undecaprenol N-acetylglucosamine transferase [Legionellaceae bacterium]